MARYRYTETDIANAVKNSTSIAGVLRALGIKQAGGSHFHMSKRIRKLGLDTSHFTGQGHSKGKSLPDRRRTPDEILVLRHSLGTRERPHLLRRALRDLGVEAVCARCATVDMWLGKPLTLHIDHINGDSLDCRSVNLRFLCPNCHSQTSTYCRKASARVRERTAA